MKKINLLTFNIILWFTTCFSQNMSFQHIKQIEGDTCIECNYVIQVKEGELRKPQETKSYKHNMLVKKVSPLINNEFEVYTYDYDSNNRLVFEKKFNTILGCVYKVKYYRFGDTLIKTASSSNDKLYESILELDLSGNVKKEKHYIDNKEVERLEYEYVYNQPKFFRYDRYMFEGDKRYMSSSFHLDSFSYTSINYNYLKNGDIDFVEFNFYNESWLPKKTRFYFEQSDSDILIDKRDFIYSDNKKKEEKNTLIYGDFTKEILSFTYKESNISNNSLLLSTNSCDH